MKKFLNYLLQGSAFGIFKNIGKIGKFFKGMRNATDSVSSWWEDTSSKLGDYATSFLDSYTGAHLTGQQVEANEMQMQNLADQYGKNVEGMQAAGINPALMYKSGATSAPSVQGSVGTGSMSDLMELIMLPLNKKMLQAQIANVNADTQSKEITNLNLDAQMKATIQSTLAGTDSVRAETLYKNLLMQYGMPEAEVNKILKDIQVGDSNITRNYAEAEFAKVNAAYTEVKKKIDLDKLPYELAKMSAEAKDSLARSIVEEYRGYYMRTYGVDVPNGAIASFVGLLTNTFSGPNMTPTESGFDELNVRTLFPFIDMILRAFGK